MNNEFEKYKIDKSIIETLSLLKYTTPTKIQELVVPAMLEGRDVVAQSQTGSGKTAAFAIPLCNQVVWEENSPQALILEPTRELAVQVGEEVFNIGRSRRIKVPLAFGGMPFDTQAKILKQKSHIVVGTPGRILDHLKKGTVSFDKVSYLVIDEADLMLDMGFLDDVEEIMSYLPEERKTMLFSATLDDNIKLLIKNYMKDPIEAIIDTPTKTVSNIYEGIYITNQENKFKIFLDILIKENPKDCMIFCGTRDMVNVLFRMLKKERLKVGMIHGLVDQRERLGIVEDFRKGKIHFLIATDVAARGIDFENITHVFNYDFPLTKETYVHRVGRTGRNGKSGRAISLLDEGEMFRKRQVEDYTLASIEICPPIEINENDKKEFLHRQRAQVVIREKKGAVLNKGITKLTISGGRKSKMRPTDIVGTICSIEQITAEDIGIIDIRDSMTFVEILNNKGNIVFEELQKKTIKGKPRKIEKRY